MKRAVIAIFLLARFRMAISLTATEIVAKTAACMTGHHRIESP
jgi:hypothetical protein